MNSFTDGPALRRRRHLPKPLRKLRKAFRFARDTLLYLLLQSGRFAFALMPIGFALRVGARCGRFAAKWLLTPRRRALENLERAFPESTEVWREEIIREVFANMGRSLVELLKLAAIRRALDDYIDCPQLPMVEEIIASGTGAIVCTGHIGNWELLAAYFGLKGFPLTVIGRRIRHPLLNRMLVRLRRRNGVFTIARSSRGASRQILQVLRAKRVLAMLIDQDTRGQSVFVPFFGYLAATPSGPATLALRAGVPIFAAFIHRRGSGRHVITVERVELPVRGPRSVEELTAVLTKMIEEQVRFHPTEWVWWHRRWRRQPPRPFQEAP